MVLAENRLRDTYTRVERVLFSLRLVTYANVRLAFSEETVFSTSKFGKTSADEVEIIIIHSLYRLKVKLTTIKIYESHRET